LPRNFFVDRKKRSFYAGKLIECGSIVLPTGSIHCKKYSQAPQNLLTASSANYPDAGLFLRQISESDVCGVIIQEKFMTVSAGFLIYAALYRLTVLAVGALSIWLGFRLFSNCSQGVSKKHWHLASQLDKL
jgi:hypothetical protein